MALSLKVKRLRPEAIAPSYAHPGDAGADLCTTETVTLQPGQRLNVPTGIAVEIPDGYVGLVWDKSGRAAKDGLTILGGVIDAGYRGEIFAITLNTSDQPVTIQQGEKIAQMLIQPVEQVSIVEAETLSDTTRGEGKFGSTGKK